MELYLFVRSKSFFTTKILSQYSSMNEKNHILCKFIMEDKENMLYSVSRKFHVFYYCVTNYIYFIYTLYIYNPFS